VSGPRDGPVDGPVDVPGPGEEIVEGRTVRPYTVTGGRTRTARHDLALETLVHAMPASVRGPAGAEPSERRGIRELVDQRMLSVAELSAHLHLPLGVIRVLVGDLIDDGLVSVNGGAQASRYAATDIEVLEGVLHGIDSL
jgi:hypothetical protein